MVRFDEEEGRSGVHIVSQGSELLGYDKGVGKELEFSGKEVLKCFYVFLKSYFVSE